MLRYKIRAMGIWAAAALAAGSIASGTKASGGTFYFNGFENAGDTSAWVNDTAGVTQSNSDAYSVGSASGSQHAVVTNIVDDFQAGYGDAGNTYFGGKVSTYPGSFEQSMAIYVNADWATPTNASTAGFWLDMSPSNSSGNSDFDAEHDFAFFADGSSVTVKADDGNGGTLANIATSGWYTFQMTYAKDGSQIATTLSVLNSSNSLVGSSATEIGGDSSVLGGNGYAWLTVWQNGFAGDHLAIDNLKTSVVPLPASAGLGFVMLGGFGALAVLRKRLSRRAAIA